MRKALCSIGAGPHAALLEISEPTFRAYAERHGYDLVHTHVLPVALGAGGVVSDTDWAMQIALIWLAHIGMDRAVGYGLKYPTGFKDTHLQRV